MRIDRLEGLPIDCEASWRRLHAAAAHPAPFTGWRWQRAWLDTLGDGCRVVTWWVTDEGEAAGGLPLYEASPGSWRIVGGADVSDYLDLVAPAGREAEVWTALVDAHGSADGQWTLGPLRASSETVRCLPLFACIEDQFATVSPVDRCPVLALPASWDAYLAALPSRHRHELERKERRLDRHVPGARVTTASTAAEVAARLDAFLALHRASRAGKARFMDARMEGFFRRALVDLAADGAARLWFLEAPEGPLAAFATLEWSDTVGLYNSGFAPAAAPYAPGVVLLGALIRTAIAEGKNRFDFLRGEERYKRDFGPVPEDVVEVVLR